MNHFVHFVLHHINFFPFPLLNLLLVGALFPMPLLLSGTNYLFYFVFRLPFLPFLPLLRHIYFLYSHLFIYGLVFWYNGLLFHGLSLVILDFPCHDCLDALLGTTVALFSFVTGSATDAVFWWWNWRKIALYCIVTKIKNIIYKIIKKK